MRPVNPIRIVGAVVVARSGLEHGGLWRLFRPQDGAGSEHISFMARSRSTGGAGVRQGVPDKFPGAFCERGPAIGAALLSSRRAGRLRFGIVLDELV